MIDFVQQMESALAGGERKKTLTEEKAIQHNRMSEGTTKDGEGKKKKEKKVFPLRWA